MFLQLYSQRPPAYRALRLVAALARATTLSGEECLQVGMRLFDNQFSHDAPLLIPLKPAADLTELTHVCHAAGIVMETVAA